jgi:hypothetical protein
MKPPLTSKTVAALGCAARLRGRHSSLKGRCAIALRATALRAALDPGASTAPTTGTRGQASSLPRPGAAHVPHKSGLYGIRGLPAVQCRVVKEWWGWSRIYGGVAGV